MVDLVQRLCLKHYVDENSSPEEIQRFIKIISELPEIITRVALDSNIAIGSAEISVVLEVFSLGENENPSLDTDFWIALAMGRDSC